jgi:hypothetical protein
MYFKYIEVLVKCILMNLRGERKGGIIGCGVWIGRLDAGLQTRVEVGCDQRFQKPVKGLAVPVYFYS